MSIIRVAKRHQYVTLDSRAVNDKRLSFRSRGVHAWLMEKPDNWTVRAESIAAQGPEGRDAIRTALRELERFGYLVRSKIRHEDGTWATESVVYEFPDAADPTQHQSPAVDSHDGLSATGFQQRSTSDGDPGPLLKILNKEDGHGTSGDVPSRGRKTKVPTDLQKRADALLRDVWDTKKARGEPRPGTFIGARKVIEKLMAAGWADTDLKTAALSAPTISIGAMEFQLNRHKMASKRSPDNVSTARDGKSGTVAW
jgi:hypothetical protein